jgi:hypothetical protein
MTGGNIIAPTMRSQAPCREVQPISAAEEVLAFIATSMAGMPTMGKRRIMGAS